MMFFIHHVQTYKNVNRKGQEMCEFAQAYDRILVQDECAMDSLKCEFEEVVKPCVLSPRPLVPSGGFDIRGGGAG